MLYQGKIKYLILIACCLCCLKLKAQNYNNYLSFGCQTAPANMWFGKMGFYHSQIPIIYQLHILQPDVIRYSRVLTKSTLFSINLFRLFYWNWNTSTINLPFRPTFLSYYIPDVRIEWGINNFSKHKHTFLLSSGLFLRLGDDLSLYYYYIGGSRLHKTTVERTAQDFGVNCGLKYTYFFSKHIGISITSNYYYLIYFHYDDYSPEVFDFSKGNLVFSWELTYRFNFKKQQNDLSH